MATDFKAGGSLAVRLLWLTILTALGLAVGLLVGSRRSGCQRVMTCLTLTAEVAEEAAREQAGSAAGRAPAGADEP